MARITINGVSLDPTASTSATSLRRRALLREDSSSSDYILVQTKHPLARAERDALGATGGKILEYVPEDTYVCRYAPSDLQAVRQLPFVSWANSYMDGFKIAPQLRAQDADVRSAELLNLPAGQAPFARHTQLVDVVLHRDVDVAAVVAKVASAAGVDPQALQSANGKLRLHVQAQRMPALCALDEVRHLEPVLQRKLFNQVALTIMGADVVHQSVELQGEGELIAVCDTGFDRGSAADPHPAFAGRVEQVIALGRATASDPDGHGTHVCGSVLGDGSSDALGRVRGSAPKARLFMQSVLDGRGDLGGLPNDVRDLFAPAYAAGARVHTNSWGAAAAGEYTTNSREVDDFVWNHRDAVILFAAGNEGSDGNGNGVIDAGSVGSPGTAKNCITVGASENARPDFRYIDGGASITTYGEGWPDAYPAAPIAGDTLANNPNGLAAFSSRGPTRDSRIKPDLVAPGTGILSTRSRAAGVGNGWGPSTDPLYFFEGGTSMATPLVAGCAAVVREYCKKVLNHSPSAALVKAILINSAANLKGQYSPSECGITPNNGEGFGRLDLLSAVAPTRDGGQFAFWDEGNALDTGDEQRFEFELAKDASSVKVSLVWTDPPGEALQNDLDLSVRSARGTVRHGNIRGSGEAFDRRNNIEQVAMSSVRKGMLTITVRAHRITLHPQSFALVAAAI